MARKRFLASSAGGIAPGSPFGSPVLGGFLFVQQIAPPIAGSSRLLQIFPLDATESIIAPGPGTGTDSLVLGLNSTQRTTNRSVLYGTNVLANATAGSNRMVLIGDNVEANPVGFNISDVVAIGIDIDTFQNTGGSSVAIGSGITNVGNGSVLIGQGILNVVGAAGNVAIGLAAIAQIDSVAIGAAANANTVGNSVAVGRSSEAGSNAVSVGRFAGNVPTSGTGSVSIGEGASANALDSIAIGQRSLVAAGHTAAIAIGRTATTVEANSVIFGGESSSNWMTTFRPGPNRPVAYPGLSIFMPSAAAGADQASAHTTMRGGLNTGNNATGGELRFQTSVVVAGSSSTYQAAQEILAIRAVAAGGTINTPSLDFSNQVSTPGALGGTLTNSPVVGNPTIWMEVLINGALKYIPAW